jgi:hypothetical protein
MNTGYLSLAKITYLWFMRADLVSGVGVGVG